jgi:hypothetical protein
MSPAIELIYPTVNLLLYDLAEGWGQSEEELTQQQQAFWQRFYGHQPKSDDLADTPQEEYSALLKKRDYPLGSNLDGYYHPVKVHDSYVLRVDCSGKNSDTLKIIPQPVAVLTEIQQHILNSLQDPNAKGTIQKAEDTIQNAKGTIGQSWVVSGVLPPNADPETTAQKCFSVLNPDRTDLWGQGTLFGASLFESWHPDHDFHLLICLFPHQPTAEVKKPIQQLFPQLIRLFLLRHKI